MPETTSSTPEGPRPPLLAGRYELLRTQGTDANTASILAWDIRLKRWRSVRVARPGDATAAERMVAVAQRAAQLEHPALERVIDVGKDGAISFVVRDRFVGSVAEHLARRGAVTPAWAVRIVARCAEGLAWAHSRDIIHGHPRPDVVQFAEDGEAVLTRFGQRAHLRDDEETRAGAPWAHLAPELRQYWEPNVSTDLFALGALLYTLLAGRHASDLFYAEAYEGLLAPVPRPLRPVVTQACAFEPTERFTSARELQNALMSRMKNLAPAKEPPPWLEVTQDFPDRGVVTEMDAILQEIATALGHRPVTAQAQPIDRGDSTIDPEQPPLPAPYTMPATPIPAPRALEASTPLGVPDYVERVAPKPAPRAVVVNAGDSVRNRRRSIGDSGLTVGQLTRFALMPMLGAMAFLGVAGGIGWYFATWETRADQRLVRAVMAEEAALGAYIVQDTELEAAWRNVLTAPADVRADYAASFVRAMKLRAEAANFPIEIENAIDRMDEAEHQWQAGW
ncbi:MAG: protein kinase [Myxococcales bacterium]|nr:protein kinase [Myxococcales bacterium]